MHSFLKKTKDATFNNTAHLVIYEGCVRVGIVLICGKPLHDRIISPRGDVWTNKTSPRGDVWTNKTSPREDVWTNKTSPRGDVWRTNKTSITQLLCIGVCGFWNCFDSIFSFSFYWYIWWLWLEELNTSLSTTFQFCRCVYLFLVRRNRA